MILWTDNLTSNSLTDCAPLPWEFVLPAPVSENIRHDKQSRQEWYQNIATRHYFYTLVEPSNPNQRVTKTDNPPRLLHGIVADFDLPLPDARVEEVVAAAKHKPTYVERSLGGNWRLVYLFEKPLPVESYDFASFVLKQARTWLALDALPGLDAPALETATRLYCNGCVWRATGAKPLSEKTVQAFYVACGREFDFRPVNHAEIPLDVVYAEVTKRFPNMAWPSEFAVDSQGPSFWVEGSTSPMSAIVKPEGMFTFSAHAAKPFYSWADILGADFCKAFVEQSMALATSGIFYDGLKFWRKLPNDEYVPEVKEDIYGYFRTTCKLSAKTDSTGCSPIDRAFQHIRDRQRIHGAAPMLFHPRGQIIPYLGNSFLNISKDRLTKPIDRTVTQADFPFIASLLGNLFEPAEQLDYFLAWLSHFYKSAHAGALLPGQAVFLAGGPGIGKTLTSNGLVGGLLGGSVDARDYVLGEDNFGGHLFEYAVWTIDDETVSDTDAARVRFNNFLKKLVANQQWLYSNKYQKPVNIPWMGRIVITLNLDFVSCRVLPALDNSTAEKISIFRCAETSKMTFPNRYEVDQLLRNERPAFARYLLDMVIRPELLDTARYGVKAFQEPSLRQRARQTSREAQFRELVVETLAMHFKDTDSDEWRGPAVNLHRLLMSNPLNTEVLRSLRIDSLSRCLEQMERSGDLQMTSETNSHGIRIWVVPRGTYFEKLAAPEAPGIPPESNTI